jgi:hypothetical protein
METGELLCTFGYNKLLTNSWVATQLAASRERFRSMKLVFWAWTIFSYYGVFWPLKRLELLTLLFNRCVCNEQCSNPAWQQHNCLPLYACTAIDLGSHSNAFISHSDCKNHNSVFDLCSSSSYLNQCMLQQGSNNLPTCSKYNSCINH